MDKLQSSFRIIRAGLKALLGFSRFSDELNNLFLCHTSDEKHVRPDMYLVKGSSRIIYVRSEYFEDAKNSSEQSIV